MSLTRLQTLLATVIAEIHEDMQSCDVEDIMVEIEEIATSKSYDSFLGAHVEKLNSELYEYKGWMPGVKPVLQELLYIVDDLLSNGFH